VKNLKISAGYLVKNNDYFLLGRPFHSIFWSIFKGGQHKGESLIETAKRELFEESFINIDDLLKKKVISRRHCEKLLCKYSVKKKRYEKIVYVYLLELPDSCIANLTTNLKCSTFSEDVGLPEITLYRWFKKEKLKDAMFRSQLWILNFI